MSESENKVRYQVMLTPELAKKVDELAERMKLSRSEFLSFLIENTIFEEGLIIKFVSSRFMEPVVSLVKSWKGKKGASDKQGGKS